MKSNQDQQSPKSRRFELIILGALGFTGKYVVKEVLKFLNNPSSPLKSIALAGRNPTKLNQTLQWAARPNPPPPLPIITADPSSLRALCAQTALILNCVSPFRLHGEPVVDACTDTGCDYLDICGESKFMEWMEANYHERAVETGLLVVSACGFDSVPAQLGFMFNSRQWVGPAVPNRVKAFVSVGSEWRVVGNFATYESAILGVANAHKLQELRRSRPRRAKQVILGPPPAKGETIENQKKIGLWAVKLPSADSVVVRRTLAILTENPHGLSGFDECAEMVEKGSLLAICEASSFWCENRLKIFIGHFPNHCGWNFHWPFWKYWLWKVASFEISFSLLLGKIT